MIPDRTLTHWSTLLGAVGYVVLVVAVGLALSWGADDQEDLAEVARRNCLAIEALRTEFRKEALLSYAQLEQNAELLEIPVTPQLRAAAIKGRDAKLARFAARPC